MYKGRLKTGEVVAVKVQRPYVLETVTADLYIIRRIGAPPFRSSAFHFVSLSVLHPLLRSY